MKKIFVLVLGLLFITSNCFATLITYTTISSDAGVTTQALNDRYSELKTVINGNIQSVNIADGTINSEDIAIQANPLKRDGENIGEYVYSGGTIATSATLASTITAMVAYIQNDADGYLHRVATAATNKTFTASKDTYVYCDFAGAFIYSEVNNGATQPSTPSNAIILAKVVTSGAAITAVTDLRQTIPTNLRIYTNYRGGCIVSADTAATVKVTAGDIELGNVGKMRKNTTDLTLAWSDIDTGAEAASTIYYVWAYPDPTNATNFACKISTSATDAANITEERLLGWFRNDESSNISWDTATISADTVGNYKGDGSGVPNMVWVRADSSVTTTSTTYVDMPNMYLPFYSSGRPVKVMFSAPFFENTQHYIRLLIDNVQVQQVYNLGTGSQTHTQTLSWAGILSKGTHTIKMQWMTVGGSTATQNGLTEGARTLTVWEE